MTKNLRSKLLLRIKNISSMDIFILFAVFFITALAYFFFSRKTEYLNVTIRLFNQDSPEYVLDSNQPKAWYVEQIKVGKSQKNQLGETLVEVVDVYSYPNSYVYSDVYVTLKIKAVQNKITKQYVYEGSPLLIHDVKSFKIQDLLVNGEIIDIFENKRETKKFKITFELQPKRVNYEYVNNGQSLIKGVDNYVADLIIKGLSIKDSKGQQIFLINEVSKKIGERILATERGILSIPDQERTQVTIEADLWAEKINDRFYYRKEETLLVDEVIWLTFEQITVPAKIIRIESN